MRPTRHSRPHQTNSEKLDAVLARLATIERTLLFVLRQEGIEMAQIDDLNAQLANMDAEIERQTTVNQSAVTLLQQLKAAVDNIQTAPDLSAAVAMAQAISAKLGTNDQALADAVTANTPAAANP